MMFVFLLRGSRDWRGCQSQDRQDEGKRSNQAFARDGHGVSPRVMTPIGFRVGTRK
jgi:hypothetical protein